MINPGKAKGSEYIPLSGRSVRWHGQVNREKSGNFSSSLLTKCFRNFHIQQEHIERANKNLLFNKLEDKLAMTAYFSRY